MVDTIRSRYNRTYVLKTDFSFITLIRTQLKNWFRLYHCKLLWEAAHDFTSANQFIEYVARYPSHYEVVSFCSGDTKCMGGKVMKSEDYGKFLRIPSMFQ